MRVFAAVMGALLGAQNAQAYPNYASCSKILAPGQNWMVSSFGVHGVTRTVTNSSIPSPSRFEARSKVFAPACSHGHSLLNDFVRQSSGSFVRLSSIATTPGLFRSYIGRPDPEPDSRGLGHRPIGRRELPCRGAVHGEALVDLRALHV